MSKIYVDTNVWISYFREEKDKLRPISEFAFNLFRKTLSCEYKVVLSSWTLFELSNKISADKLQEFIHELDVAGKLMVVKAENDDFSTAKKHNHWHDRLHEILALKSGARFLVTRNINDFSGDLVEIKLPENL